ncbi:MAG: hypothetical protein JNM27_15500 [Leptospirales bacterium]|nr:hypothetical protein [Leptospirales bacterium]
MSKIRIAGRYFRPALADLIRGLHRAGLSSNKKTHAEKVVGYVQFSVTNDFRSGFQPRVHRFDAMSIANRFVENIRPAIAAETRRQEVEYLNETIRSCLDYVRLAENRLSEIDGESGPLLLLERMREIREARASR